MKNDNLNQIAERLIDRLLECGFVIQRYDAYSTNSIYLKLDYGVGNSIRIGDHRGKAGLQYRYNIGPNIQKYHIKNDRYLRYYFPADEAERLASLIEEERIQKIRKYGTKNYFMYMECNKEEGRTKPGFWQRAHLVERRDLCF